MFETVDLDWCEAQLKEPRPVIGWVDGVWRD